MAELNSRLVTEVGVEAFYQRMLGDRLVSTSGARFKALCPFHDDSEPSFSIEADAGLWKCYAGCGEGDMVTFFGKARGIDLKTSFPAVAAGVEEEFLGGKKASRPIAPPPRKLADRDLFSEVWEQHSTKVLATGTLVEGLPAEYGARLADRGTPEAAVLLPVYSAETKSIVSVKRRYIEPYCLVCRGSAKEACEAHPRRKGQEGAVKKSLNLERVCLACSKDRDDLMPATGGCFRDHKADTVGFPVGFMGLPLLDAHPLAVVVLDEGEKDMLALGKRVDLDRFVPLSASAGASSIPAGAAGLLRGRDILLLFDADRSGSIGGKKWAAALLGSAKSVRRADLREVPGGLIDGKVRKDVHDYIHGGGDIEALLSWGMALPEEKPEPEAPADLGGELPAHAGNGHKGEDLRGLTYACSRERDDRPVIRITPDFDLVVDAAEDVLVRSGVALFKRGGMVVRVCRSGKKKQKKEKFVRAMDAPYLDVVPEEALSDSLSRMARFERWVPGKGEDEKGEPVEGSWKQARAPAEIGRQLLSRSEWRFRYLEGVVSWPVLRPDGSIFDTPGYDEQTGIIYEPNGTFDPIPEKPTRADAEKAMQELIDPFEKFPFVNPWDLACTMAAILTLAGRSAIEGPVPAFAVSAPTPGTGKTRIVDMISVIVTGHTPAVTPWFKDDKEWNNIIVSFGKSGDPIVNVDNVEGVLKSSNLAAALTAREYKARLFHSQRTVSVPVRMVWFLTANNFAAKGDLYRRILRIEIDSGVEDPEKRVFERKDILAYVAERRAPLLAAAMTILRAYCHAGCPPQGESAPRGSYEEWDALVRGAVLWVMGIDPCGGVDAMKKEADPEVRQMRGLLSAWDSCLPAGRFTANEICEYVNQADPSMAPLVAALANMADKRDGLSPRALGGILAKNKGKIFDDLRLLQAGENRNKVALWEVVQARQIATRVP